MLATGEQQRFTRARGKLTVNEKLQHGRASRKRDVPYLRNKTSRSLSLSLSIVLIGLLIAQPTIVHIYEAIVLAPPVEEGGWDGRNGGGIFQRMKFVVGISFTSRIQIDLQQRNVFPLYLNQSFAE